ncbi:hypothetical protein ABKN59_010823 [Abortiporus biennis]
MFNFTHLLSTKSSLHRSPVLSTHRILLTLYTDTGNATQSSECDIARRKAGEGWKNASEILRKYDDKKIKSCKEDIDTLLVITGLFTDSGIGKVVSALVFSWLTIYFIATIAPILSAQNPWKTPFLAGLLTVIRNRLRLMVTFIVLVYKQTRLTVPPSISSDHHCAQMEIEKNNTTMPNGKSHPRKLWSSVATPLHKLVPYSPPPTFLAEFRNISYRLKVGDEYLIQSDRNLDVASLLAADATFTDEGFIDTLVKCIADLSLDDAILCSEQVLIRRYKGERSPMLGSAGDDLTPQARYWESLKYPAQAISDEGLNKLRVGVLNAVESHLAEPPFIENGKLNHSLSSLSSALRFILSPTTLALDPEHSKRVAALYNKMVELNKYVACQALTSLCLYLSIHTRHGRTYEVIPISNKGLNNLTIAAHMLLDQLEWVEHRKTCPVNPFNATTENKIRVPNDPNDQPRPSLICAAVLTHIVRVEATLLNDNVDKIKHMLRCFRFAMGREKQKFGYYSAPKGRGYFYNHLLLKALVAFAGAESKKVYMEEFIEFAQTDEEWMDLLVRDHKRCRTILQYKGLPLRINRNTDYRRIKHVSTRLSSTLLASFANPSVSRHPLPISMTDNVPSCGNATLEIGRKDCNLERPSTLPLPTCILVDHSAQNGNFKKFRSRSASSFLSI